MTRSSLFHPAPFWRILYLVYRHIDVEYTDPLGQQHRYVHTLERHAEASATRAFRAFPGLAAECSQGSALLLYDLIYCDRSLSSVTPLDDSHYWISPADTQPELEHYLATSDYDSVLVLWPQSLHAEHRIPSIGWGLAIGGYAATYGATYATVAPAPDWAWEQPTLGEPWLHEWLHGVSAHYRHLGFTLPDADADGAHLHGYTRSETEGWVPYYRDLMTGNVLAKDQTCGIPPTAWQQGGPHRHFAQVWVDYFTHNSLNAYHIQGHVTWDPTLHMVHLGTAKATTVHSLERELSLNGNYWVRARILLPHSGPDDSVALVLHTQANQRYKAIVQGPQDPEDQGEMILAKDDQTLHRVPSVLKWGYWYTVKILWRISTCRLYVNVWADGESNSMWQITHSLQSTGSLKALSLEHWGTGSWVSELIACEDPICEKGA